MSIKQGSNYLAVSNVSVDGDTISANTYNSLQAIGTINKNSTAVDTIKYDWVGTSSEYTTQNIASLHPEWICYITDDDASELLNTAWASGLGMPDFMHTEAVTILASGSEYTAPANGWFVCTGMSGSGNIGTIQISSTVNSTLPEMRIASWATGATNRACGVIFPAKAGDTIVMYYGTYTNDKHFYFIYAEGNGQ